MVQLAPSSSPTLSNRAVPSRPPYWSGEDGSLKSSLTLTRCLFAMQDHLTGPIEGELSVPAEDLFSWWNDWMSRSCSRMFMAMSRNCLDLSLRHHVQFLQQSLECEGLLSLCMYPLQQVLQIFEFLNSSTSYTRNLLASYLLSLMLRDEAQPLSFPLLAGSDSCRRKACSA